MRYRWAVVILLGALHACGDPQPTNDAARVPAGPTSDTLPPDTLDAVPAPDSLRPGDARADSLRADSVRADSLRAALDSLVAGAAVGDLAAGQSTWFTAETRGAVKEVRIDGGAAVVDFRESLSRLIPGAGSSAGSEALLAELDSTVFRFPFVETVEYRLGGSCDAFWAWLQRACAVVGR